MTDQIQIGNLKVDVVFKDIKNIHLSVHPPTGRVRIAAPRRMKLDTIRVYAISKIDWIKKHQEKLKSQERETPREYLDRFYLDTLVHDPMMLDFLMKLMGPERLALGTDYPFPLGELEPGKLIDSMPYEASVKERLLSGTALEWLGMGLQDFTA